MRPLARLAFLVPVSLLALQAFGFLRIRNEKLSYSFSLDAGDVSEYSVSPDGQWLVYRGNGTTSFRHELYAVPADGSSAPVEISGGQNVLEDFSFSPDGARVLFLAVDIGPARLYSTALSGSPPVELSGTMASGATGVQSFRVTPDSQRVLYAADENTANVEELFMAPADGSLPSIRLSDSPTVGSGLFDFILSPDGTQAVYRGSFSASWHELHAVAVDGSAPPVRLHSDPVHGGEIFEYGVSADSQRAIFQGDIITNGTTELFEAPLDASTAPWTIQSDEPALLGVSPHSPVAIYSRPSGCCQLQLWAVALDGTQTETLLESGSALATYYDLEFSQDGNRLVYRRLFGSRFELFSVPLDASTAATKLNDPLPAGGSIYGFLITPDAADVVYWGQQANQFYQDIYRVPIDDSSAPVRLTPPDSNVSHVALVGARLVYIQIDGSLDNLMSVPLDGSAISSLLHTPASPGRNPTDGPFAAASVPGLGHEVFFTGDLMIDGVVELYRTPADGTGSEQVMNGPLIPEPRSAVSSLAVLPDESKVLYNESYYHSGGVYEVPLDPRGPVSALDLSLSQYRRIQPTPDGSRILIFNGDSSLSDMHVMPVDGSAPPQQLWAHGADKVEFSPDGSWISFVDNDYTNGTRGPYGVPVDGSAPALLLAGGKYSATVGFSSDSSLLVSVSGGPHMFGNEPYRIWSAPVDGSPRIELTSPPTSDLRVIFGATLTPDRARVVYVVDDGTGISEEVAVVPIDGSAGATTLATQSNASHLTPTPDNTRAVFIADRDVADRNELYVVPLDGSSTPQKLSGPSIPEGDVQGPPVITPDGARVLYRADAQQDEVFELFSAPINGSTPPVKISGSMVSGGDVVGSNQDDPPFSITPDGGRVVFRADMELNNVYGLYVAPIDGSTPAVRVHPPLTSSWGVEDEHLVLEDSSAVIYRANLIPGQTDLWISSLDGTRTRRLSYLDDTGGEVEPGYVLVGDYVYYLADQQIRHNTELFRSQLVPQRRHRAGSPGTAPTQTVGTGN